jgi:hypothetical protein
MRKHRLYGFSLAMLAAAGTGTGVAVTQWPGHDQHSGASGTNDPNARGPVRSSNVDYIVKSSAKQRALRRKFISFETKQFLIKANQFTQWVNAGKWDQYVAQQNLEQASEAQQAQAQDAGQAQQQTPSTSTVSNDSGSAPSSDASGGGAGGGLAALRACESGGDYSDNTGNGFYGAYQFSQSTWDSLGMSGLPSDASPAQQDAAAEELQAEDGWSPWPACSAELGL